jgi:hypothetical protein
VRVPLFGLWIQADRRSALLGGPPRLDNIPRFSDPWLVTILYTYPEPTLA